MSSVTFVPSFSPRLCVGCARKTKRMHKQISTTHHPQMNEEDEEEDIPNSNSRNRFLAAAASPSHRSHSSLVSQANLFPSTATRSAMYEVVLSGLSGRRLRHRPRLLHKEDENRCKLERLLKYGLTPDKVQFFVSHGGQEATAGAARRRTRFSFRARFIGVVGNRKIRVFYKMGWHA